MSYTFSRRDFFKYTALAAVAVAGSSLLTGCSNPNQPSAVYTGTADVKQSFGGSSSILSLNQNDYHILHKGATWTSSTTDGLHAVFSFTHYAVSEGTSCGANYYQIDVIDKDNKVHSYYNGTQDVTFTANGGGTMTVLKKEYNNTLTIDGKIDTTNAKNIYLRYFPRHTALGNTNDSYSDVFVTWDLTDWILKAKG